MVGIAIDGNYVYLAGRGTPPDNAVLRVFDVSNLSNPTLVATARDLALDSAHWPSRLGERLVVSGGYAYGTGAGGGLEVFDVSDPTQPVEARYETYERSDVILSGSVVYALGQLGRVIALDVSDVAHPALLASDEDATWPFSHLAVANS